MCEENIPDIYTGWLSNVVDSISDCHVGVFTLQFRFLLLLCDSEHEILRIIEESRRRDDRYSRVPP